MINFNQEKELEKSKGYLEIQRQKTKYQTMSYLEFDFFIAYRFSDGLLV